MASRRTEERLRVHGGLYKLLYSLSTAAEYLHIGAMTMRVASSTLPTRSGVNRRALLIEGPPGLRNQTDRCRSGRAQAFLRRHGVDLRKHDGRRVALTAVIRTSSQDAQEGTSWRRQNS